MRLELWCLLLTAAVSLSGSGCLRWGYGPRREAPAAYGDGGVFDSGAAYAGGSGGGGAVSGAGAGGQAGKTSSGGGSLAAGSGGRAGALASAGASGDPGGSVDAGTIGGPTDAGVDSGAGLMDAGAPDGGSITYAGCPSRPGVLFCDDFEAPDPSFTHWSFDTTTNGAVTRTQALSHGGQWSLLAATTQNTSSTSGAQARMATVALNHLASGHVWMR